MDILESLLHTTVFRLEENLRRIEHCLDLIDEDSMWIKANDESNSIGNLILHLNGNIGQYILSCLGGKEDMRNRINEFNIESRIPKDKLLDMHAHIISSAIGVVKKLDNKKIKGHYKVQGFDMNGVEILVHVVEHSSYHTGQIAQAVKLITNRDLGFYKGVNLDKLNK